MEQTTLKKLPVGITDFRTIRTGNYYYADKTSWIATLIDRHCWGMSLHYLRPRHFGKSLAMDMVRRFFDCEEKEQNRPLFEGLAVSKEERWMAEQGKYPVLYFDFKTATGNTQAELELALRKALRKGLEPLDNVLRNGELDEFERAVLSQTLEQLDTDPNASDNAHSYICLSMNMLCRSLAKHYGQNVVILFDDYDTPLQAAYKCGCYKHMCSTLDNIFCSALKGNRYQRLGILMGTIRFPKPGIFSGLNNMLVENILDKDGADSFGLTPAEVEQLAEYYGAKDKLEEIKEWYGGYRVDEQELYNPDSVMRYFANKCTPQVYWPDDLRNSLMKERWLRLAKAEPEDIKKLGESNIVWSELDPEITHDQLAEEQSDVDYSMLTVSGYLAPTDHYHEWHCTWYGDLAIPNKEMREVIDGMIKPG